jgi:hypothetical protein
MRGRTDWTRAARPINVAASGNLSLWNPQMLRNLILFVCLGLMVGCDVPVAGTTAEVADITADRRVGFGDLGRNCAVSGAALGKQVTAAAGFAIHDTAPGGTGQRTHYITGFQDGCPRQFTGALVLLGDVGTHELVRYADIGLDQPYTPTDDAYERLKTSFCGARRGQPCGGRIDSLAGRATFVTVYDGFGDAADWMDILLYAGDVLAFDVNDG